MLGGCREAGGPIIANSVEGTWIRSDLHLNDRAVLESFERPFDDVAAMNRHLLAGWRSLCSPATRSSRRSRTQRRPCRRVRRIAHPDAWRSLTLTSSPRVERVGGSKRPSLQFRQGADVQRCEGVAVGGLPALAAQDAGDRVIGMVADPTGARARPCLRRFRSQPAARVSMGSTATTTRPTRACAT